MSGRVEEYAEGRPGLMFVLGGAEIEYGCLCCIEVVDDNVEVHVLWGILRRPIGRVVALDVLEVDALAVLRAYLDHVVENCDWPIQHCTVERREGSGVGTVDDKAGKSSDGHSADDTRRASARECAYGEPEIAPRSVKHHPNTVTRIRRTSVALHPNRVCRASAELHISRVGRPGIEPGTRGLKVRCSTD